MELIVLASFRFLEIDLESTGVPTAEYSSAITGIQIVP